MKKFFAMLLVVAFLTVIFCPAYLAEVATAPPAPMFTVDVTQLIIAVMAVVFNILLAWIIKAIIPPAKRWFDEHCTTEQQTRAWTMIKWLVEAAEQTITGYSKGSERLDWVLAELKARGITADPTLIEAAVKEMKDNASKEIRQAIEKPEPDGDCEDCMISIDD